MKIYLDDSPERLTPEGWHRVWDYEQAVEVVRTADHDGIEITEMSLDHDLALAHYSNDSKVREGSTDKTGYDFVKWLVESNLWPTRAIHVHSFNAAGSANMVGTIERYGPYDRKVGRSFYKGD